MLLACSNMTSPGLLVEQRRLPPAVREAAVAVLVGPARCLCHPVQRHELGHDQLAHGVLLAWCRCVPVYDAVVGSKSSDTTEVLPEVQLDWPI